MYHANNETVPVDSLKPMTPQEAKIYWDYHAKLPTYTEGYERKNGAHYAEELISVRKLARTLTDSKELIDEIVNTITISNDTNTVTKNKTVYEIVKNKAVDEPVENKAIDETVENEIVDETAKNKTFKSRGNKDDSLVYTNLNVADHPAWRLIEDPEEGCGESTADRIIGGKDAALGQYPWIALLGYGERRIKINKEKSY